MTGTRFLSDHDGETRIKRRRSPIGLLSPFPNSVRPFPLTRLPVAFPVAFLTSSFSPLTSYIVIGPYPAQLVVVTSVRNAVSAATTIFTAISINRFFFIFL